MLFVGAGGLAAQLFDDLLAMKMEDVAFWSGVESGNDFIKERFSVFSSDAEVKEYFEKVSDSFVICLGDRADRRTMRNRFEELGGKPGKFISPYGNHSAFIGSIGPGSIILRDVDLEPDVTIGDFCLINKQCNFGHGATVSSFCDIGPMVTVSAESFIGENCMIGMHSTIIPRVKIGKNVIISAGSVVTKNLPDNAVVSGVPARLRFKQK